MAVVCWRLNPPPGIHARVQNMAAEEGRSVANYSCDSSQRRLIFAPAKRLSVPRRTPLSNGFVNKRSRFDHRRRVAVALQRIRSPRADRGACVIAQSRLGRSRDRRRRDHCYQNIIGRRQRTASCDHARIRIRADIGATPLPAKPGDFLSVLMDHFCRRDCKPGGPLFAGRE